MNVTHRTTVHGKCHINGSWDYYDVEITTDQFIKVEDIESRLDLEVRGKMEPQETLAERIAKAFPSHCKITVVGRHSQNTLTTVEVFAG